MRSTMDVVEVSSPDCPPELSYNPFADPAVAAAAGSDELNQDFVSLDLGVEGAGYETGHMHSGRTKVSMTLAEREAALRRKESELQRREAALNSGGAVDTANTGKVANWPSEKFPIVHHDIEGDIPIDAQPLLRMAYTAWKYMAAGLVLNLVIVMIAAFHHNYWESPSANGSSVFSATLYTLVGLPVSFLYWYMNLYRIAIKSKTKYWMVFMVSFVVHVIFTVLMLSGCPWYPVTGIFFVLTCVMSGFHILTFLSCVNTVVWAIVLGYSIAVYHNARQIYSNTGAEAQTKTDVRSGIAALALKLHSAKTSGNKPQQSYSVV